MAVAKNPVRERLERLFDERILVLDGAMGTMLQAEKLSAADFRGERFANHGHELKGDSDILVLTRPDVVQQLDAARGAGRPGRFEGAPKGVSLISQEDLPGFGTLPTSRR